MKQVEKRIEKRIPKRANWYKIKWYQKVKCYLGLHNYQEWQYPYVLPGPPEGTKGMCHNCGKHWTL